jgi:hypothetical protein
MSKGVVVSLSVVGILVVLGLIGFGSYVSNYNYGNEAEKQLTAKLKDNQNVRSNYVAKVQELVQVNDMYKDALKEVVVGAIEGRYGDKGSQATWQWIKEKNPTVDATLYIKLAQVIEAGRNEFKNSQTELLDIKRSYETNLGYFWKGMWLKFAGYPKINLDDIKVIITKDTTEAYQKGEDAAIQLRPAAK